MNKKKIILIYNDNDDGLIVKMFDYKEEFVKYFAGLEHHYSSVTVLTGENVVLEGRRDSWEENTHKDFLDNTAVLMGDFVKRTQIEELSTARDGLES